MVLHGCSISQEFNAILKVIQGLILGYHCVEQSKLHQIPKRNRIKKANFLWGVEVVIFGQSTNGEFSIKRHKTSMFYRSEQNLVLNENLDHSLSDQIV